MKTSLKQLERKRVYLIDANIILEVLYKRDKWRKCFELLNYVKTGKLRAYVLKFTIHGISAILGNPNLVSKFLAEINTWRGLAIVDLSIEEMILSCKIAEETNLDFDDSLHYYFAKTHNIPIVSFDKDFDNVDIERVEPIDILKTLYNT